MSEQIDNNATFQNETTSQETPRSCAPRRRCCWKYGLIAGLILGTLAAAVLLVVCRPQYEATAKVLIRAARPQLIVETRPLDHYEEFANSQLVLMRSPAVIDRTLENPEVARLSTILRQKDKRAWLTRKLRVERIHRSEVVIISIKTNFEDASEKIVNAVVGAYMNYIDDVGREATASLMSRLRLEEQRQRRLAQQLHEGIRSKTRQAAVHGAVSGQMNMSTGLLEQGETWMREILREIFLAEIKLTTLRVQRRVIAERIDRPDMMPLSILIQTSPQYKTLNGQKEYLEQQREELSRVYTKDDPRIVDIKQQIKETDAQIENLVTGADTGTLQTMRSQMQNQLRFQEEANLFQISQDIRTQEIILEELTKKYTEQLQRSVAQAENVLDVSFEITQLERTNKTLNKIEDRILDISTEQRAPGQITPVSMAVNSIQPSRKTQIMAAGAGFVLFFFLPLLCTASCRYCCRRA